MAVWVEISGFDRGELRCKQARATLARDHIATLDLEVSTARGHGESDFIGALLAASRTGEVVIRSGNRGKNEVEDLGNGLLVGAWQTQAQDVLVLRMIVCAVDATQNNVDALRVMLTKLSGRYAASGCLYYQRGSGAYWRKYLGRLTRGLFDNGAHWLDDDGETLLPLHTLHFFPAAQTGLDRIRQIATFLERSGKVKGYVLLPGREFPLEWIPGSVAGGNNGLVNIGGNGWKPATNSPTSLQPVGAGGCPIIFTQVLDVNWDQEVPDSRFCNQVKVAIAFASSSAADYNTLQQLLGNGWGEIPRMPGSVQFGGSVLFAEEVTLSATEPEDQENQPQESPKVVAEVTTWTDNAVQAGTERSELAEIHEAELTFKGWRLADEGGQEQFVNLEAPAPAGLDPDDAEMLSTVIYGLLLTPGPAVTQPAAWYATYPEEEPVRVLLRQGGIPLVLGSRQSLNREIEDKADVALTAERLVLVQAEQLEAKAEVIVEKDLSVGGHTTVGGNMTVDGELNAGK